MKDQMQSVPRTEIRNRYGQVIFTAFAEDADAAVAIAVSKRTDLAGADLAGVKFRQDKKLKWAKLEDANLAGAGLRKVRLDRARLRGADLTGADLSWASLLRADLSGARMQGARLHGANLAGANLSGTGLTSEDLRNARFEAGDARCSGWGRGDGTVAAADILPTAVGELLAAATRHLEGREAVDLLSGLRQKIWGGEDLSRQKFWKALGCLEGHDGLPAGVGAVQELVTRKSLSAGTLAKNDWWLVLVDPLGTGHPPGVNPYSRAWVSQIDEMLKQLGGPATEEKKTWRVVVQDCGFSEKWVSIYETAEEAEEGIEGMREAAITPIDVREVELPASWDPGTFAELCEHVLQEVLRA